MLVWVLVGILWADFTKYSSAQALLSGESVYAEATVKIIPADAIIRIAEGGNVTLKCLIGGHPRAKPKWLLPRTYSRRRLIADEEELSIVNVRRHEHGSVTCSAYNGYKRPQFATTIIQVYFLTPPTLRLYEATSTVAPWSDWYSRTVHLLCQTSSYPEPQVTWYWKRIEINTAISEYYDFTIISLENYDEPFSSHLLKIRNVTQRHNGDYACKASLGVGRIYGIPDTEASITISDNIEKPSIRILNGDVINVNPGSDIDLVCEAMSGTPLPRISWNKDDKILPHSKRCTALPEKIVLRLINVQVVDAGVYSCNADNSIQKVAVRRVKVVVRYIDPMHLWITPDARSGSGKLEVGKDIALTCYVDARPVEELQYVWYKRVGRAVTPIRRDNLPSNFVIEKLLKVDNTKAITSYSSVLEIRNATEDNYGTYVCNATLVCPTFDTAVTTSVSITRDSAPSRITVAKALFTVEERQDAILQCKATGQPEARIEWFQNGNGTITSDRMGVSEDGTLTIKNVSRHDDGIYTCKPSLQNGFDQLAKRNGQAEVQLRVKCLPDVRPTYQLRRAALFSELVLQCTSLADSHDRSLGFQWFKDDRRDAIGTSSKISLSKITESQFGMYYCQVNNAVGPSRCVFNVTGIAYSPDFYYEEELSRKRRPMSTSSLPNTTNISYRLKWTQPNPKSVGQITEYRVRWKRVSDPQFTTSATWHEETMPIDEEITVGKLLFYDMTDLSVPARYAVEVTPKNAFGYGDTASRNVTTRTNRAIIVLDNKLNCTFSNGDMCGFTQEPQRDNTGIQDPTDDFDWTMSNARNTVRRTLGTGPSQDHTFGDRNGGYMYIESSNAKKNSRARLASPKLSNKKGACSCLKFFYHMWGDEIGTLNILIRAANDNIIWSKSGPQGNRWKKGVVTITQRVHYRVVFEAIMINPTGPLYLGDIAIDDVSIDVGSCPPLRTTAMSPVFSTSGSRQLHRNIVDILHQHHTPHQYLNSSFVIIFLLTIFSVNIVF